MTDHEKDALLDRLSDALANATGDVEDRRFTITGDDVLGAIALCDEENDPDGNVRRIWRDLLSQLKERDGPQQVRLMTPARDGED